MRMKSDRRLSKRTGDVTQLASWGMSGGVARALSLHRRPRWWPLLATLVLAAAPARAEAPTDLMARAPALTLDGPLTALTAPLAVGGAGWGPFTRLCVRRMMVAPDGREFPANDPSCLQVTEAREAAGVWHLTLSTGPLQNGVGVTFTLTRDASGQVGPADFTVPEGLPAPPPNMVAELRAVFRAMIRAHALEAFRVAPGEGFVMDLPLGEVEEGMRVEGGGFVCLSEGTSTIAGRPVLQAACTLRAIGPLRPGRVREIAAAGRFALDVATGLVLRHG